MHMDTSGGPDESHSCSSLAAIFVPQRRSTILRRLVDISEGSNPSPFFFPLFCLMPESPKRGFTCD